MTVLQVLFFGWTAASSSTWWWLRIAGALFALVGVVDLVRFAVWRARR